MADSTTSGGTHASREAIDSAYRALTREELKRLFCSARVFLARAAKANLGRSPDDLCGEALLRTYAGTRHWAPQRVDLVGHLVGAMRSIVDEWSRKARRLPLLGLVDDEYSSGHGTVVGDVASPEDALAEQEEQHHVLRQIQKALPNDEHVEYILMGLDDGLGRAEIMRQSGMTELQYDAAKKRVLRVRWQSNTSGSRP